MSPRQAKIFSKRVNSNSFGKRAAIKMRNMKSVAFATLFVVIGLPASLYSALILEGYLTRFPTFLTPGEVIARQVLPERQWDRLLWGTEAFADGLLLWLGICIAFVIFRKLRNRL
jgi:hypothetical protein